MRELGLDLAKMATGVVGQALQASEHGKHAEHDQPAVGRSPGIVVVEVERIPVVAGSGKSLQLAFCEPQRPALLRAQMILSMEAMVG